MDRRVGQLAGIFAGSLVILRLGRLLESGPEYPNWQLILIASAVLGGVVWWLLGQLLRGRWLPIALFTVGATVLFLRISVPDTLNWVIPTTETPAALLAEMKESSRLIRSGIPPIDPLPGVVAILAVLMWAAGALYSWGLTGGPVAAMILPSLVLYLQFAVFDRQRAEPHWLVASATLLAMTVVALGLERRGETGRARDASGRPLPRRSRVLATVTAGALGVVAVIAASSATSLVSEYGNVPWRGQGSGYGSGGGPTTFTRLADLQQRLVELPDTVMFKAALSPEAPPAEELYWPVESLDRFDGRLWKPSTATRPYEPGRPAGDEDHRYQGATSEISAVVLIHNLAQSVAPRIGGVSQIDAIEGGIRPTDFDTAQDGSLVFVPGLAPGDTYQFRTYRPEYQQDLAILATTPDGELSPTFAAAVEQGILSIAPQASAAAGTRPNDLADFLELPPDTPSELTLIARARTAGATTDFERAWMLERWFRDPGEFVYSTAVTTGEGSLDLVAWLTDADSLNHRTGYCQQFASAMAVLGRALGIPSKVIWGFTPGTLTTQETTNEDGTVDTLDVIEVRGTNAHAWVEMWFDPVGWVRFDPTPRGDFVVPTAGFDAQTPVVDGNNAPGIPTDDLDDGGLLAIPDPVGSGTALDTGPRWWLIALVGIALLLPVIPSIKAMRRRRRLTLIRDGDITAAWDEIVDRLADLGEPISPNLTPMEVARATDPSLMSLAVSYSAAVYGGRTGRANEMDLLEVEGWLEREFTTSERAKAALALKSFFRNR